MLQSIRDGAKGGCAWLIVGFITVPFALFGISEYLGVSGEPVAAEVNGKEITDRALAQEVGSYKQRLREQLGKAYNPTLFDDATIENQVLSNLVRNELILQTAAELGFQASNTQVKNYIRSTPNFQLGGKFNLEIYQQEIASLGYSEAGLEAKIRGILVSKQLSEAFVQSESLTPAETSEIQRLTNQARDFDVLTIDAKKYLETVSVADDEIAKYYDENKSRFMAPERVKLEFVEVKLKDVSAKVEVDDDAIKEFYQENLEAAKSQEKRQASHILLANNDEIDEEVLKKQADELKARLVAGADFSGLAKELSSDSGTASSGGDLGAISKGDLGGDLEDTIFSLSLNEIKVVQSEFGLHVVKLTKIESPEIQSFEDSKAEMTEAYKKQQAEKQFYEVIEGLKELAFDESTTLEPAAESVEKEVILSDWLDRGSRQGLFSYDKVEEMAFSDEVLNSGHNSEVIEINSEHVLVLRVNTYEESSARPLVDVKSSIEELLKNKKAAEMAKIAGEALLVEVNSGKTLSDVATDNKLSSFVKANRQSKDVSIQVLQRVFQLKHPETSNVNASLALVNGDYVIIQLSNVENIAESSDEAKAQQEAFAVRLSQGKGRAYFDHLLSNVQNSGDVKVLKKASAE